MFKKKPIGVLNLKLKLTFFHFETTRNMIAVVAAAPILPPPPPPVALAAPAVLRGPAFGMRL